MHLLAGARVDEVPRLEKEGNVPNVMKTKGNQ
jgi:hypothetical protein